MQNVIEALPTHLLQGPEEASKPKNEMGKHEFMKILVTQLQNQDPLKPMENREFITQLAQFSSLEELTNIGDGIKGLGSSGDQVAKQQALTMIGKDIEATGAHIELKKGNPVTIRHSLPDNLKPLRASIKDPSGNLVRTIDLSQRSGETARSIIWDGKNEEGEALPAGKYTFRVLGADAQGHVKEVGTGISGRVVGLKMEGSIPTLMVKSAEGEQEVEMSAIVKVSLAQDKSQSLQKQHLAPKTTEMGKEVASHLSSVGEEDGFSAVDRNWRRHAVMDPLGGYRK